MQTKEAVSIDGVTLNSGTFIEVVGVVGETLQVKAIDSGTVREEEE
jgi:hypothetical protein